MRKPIVFMYSGQGSQYYHMGQELYEKNPRFRLWMDYCDEIAQPLIQTSLIDILYSKANSAGLFDDILYTNPALLCIEYSLTRVLMEMNVRPDYLLGYSLGEVTASVVSGSITLEEGVNLAVDFGRLLKRESPSAAMLAIIETEDLMKKRPESFDGCWITGRNFDNNFVVSGLLQDVEHLEHILREEDVLFQRLPVNFGFHTCLMDPLEAQFKQLAGKINFSANSTPAVSSLSGREVDVVNEDYLWDVVRYPVEFSNTIRYMLRKGDCIFVDVGPSGTLASTVKYLLPAQSESLHLEVINKFGKNLSSIEKMTQRFLQEGVDLKHMH